MVGGALGVSEWFGEHWGSVGGWWDTVGQVGG